MISKGLKVCVALVFLSGLSACSDGEYSDLKCDESYQSECLSAQHYMTCDNGSLIMVMCDTGSTCVEESSVDANNVATRTATCRAKSDIPGTTPNPDLNPTPASCTVDKCISETVLQKCNTETQTVAGTMICPNGCNLTTNACNEPAKCTADVCKDSTTLIVCDTATGTTSEIVCEYGCDTALAACKKDENNPPVPTVDPCQNITCDAGSTCNKGICVPDSMNGANENDPWQEGWVEHCEGNKAVMNFFDPETYESFVAIMDCGASGCSIVNADYGDGEQTALAWCNDESSRCENNGDELGYCVEEEFDGETYAYSNRYVCMTNTEGSLTSVDMGLMEDPFICGSNMCLADKSGCQKLFDTEGEVCDEGSADTCAGTFVVGCYDSDYDGVSRWEGVDCTTHEEFGPGYTCMTFDDSDVTTGFCFNDESICEAGAEDVRRCDEKNENVLIDVCKATSDGKNHIVAYKESCAHGCDPATNDCIKLDPTEGDPCDTETYVSSCTEGGVALSCMSGTDGAGNPVSQIVAEECDTCMVIDGEASCVNPCTELDAVKSVCETYLDSGYLANLKCVQNGENAAELYWTVDSDVSCMLGCNAENNACLPVTNEAGDKCSAEAAAKCMEDGAEEDGIVGCAIPADAAVGEGLCHGGACDAAGEVAGSRKCTDDGLALLFGAYVEYEDCVETKGDGNVLSYEMDLCESGECNADKTDCAPVDVE